MSCVVQGVAVWVAVWCRVLQCVWVWCSVLQCDAVCCSVLRCVAVCCRALIWVTVFHVIWRIHMYHDSIICDVTLRMSHVAHERVTSHMNKSWHTWMSHGTYQQGVDSCVFSFLQCGSRCCCSVICCSVLQDADLGVGISDICHTCFWCMSHERVSMSQTTRMNESCRTYEWVMSHIWMSHVTRMNESCHTYEWVMSRIFLMHVNESVWVKSHVWMSHVTNESVWVKSHVWMSHIIRMNKSRHTYEWVTRMNKSHVWMSHTYE